MQKFRLCLAALDLNLQRVCFRWSTLLTISWSRDKAMPRRNRSTSPRTNLFVQQKIILNFNLTRTSKPTGSSLWGMDHGTWPHTLMECFGCPMLNLAFSYMDFRLLAQPYLPLKMRTEMRTFGWQRSGIQKGCFDFTGSRWSQGTSPVFSMPTSPRRLTGRSAIGEFQTPVNTDLMGPLVTCPLASCSPT